jgi:hypothetical protein
MASSIINSDDGVVSGTSGLKTTGGDDGVLNIQNNGTTAVTVNASGNVGIGTTTPATKLNVYDASSAIIDVSGDSASVLRASRYSTDASPPQIVSRKARGTLASPSAVTNSDLAGGLFFQAYGGTNFRTVGRIDGVVNTFTSNDNISGGLVFYSNAGSTDVSPVMRLTSDKYLRFDSGTGGIQFNGDTAAANALDDYEEGTWTATFFDAASGGNQSSTTSTGSYTKIGDMVFFSFALEDVSTAGMTGANRAFFTLPFSTSATLAKNNCALAHVLYQGLNWSTGTQLSSYIAQNFNRMSFFTAGDNVGYAELLVSAIGSGSGRFYVSGQFRV